MVAILQLTGVFFLEVGSPLRVGSFGFVFAHFELQFCVFPLEFFVLLGKLFVLKEKGLKIRDVFGGESGENVLAEIEGEEAESLGDLD